MSTSDKQLFFAGRRCFYTDGATFLTSISLNTGKQLSVTESKVAAFGISLGSFFHAILTSEGRLKDIELARLSNPPDVQVVDTFAHIRNIEAEVISDGGGMSFKTEMFGFVELAGTNLALGTYRITMRLSKSSENPTKTQPYRLLSCEPIRLYQQSQKTTYAPPPPPPPTPSPRTSAPEDPFTSTSRPASFFMSLEPLPDLDQLKRGIEEQKRNRALSPAASYSSDGSELPKVPRLPEPPRNKVEEVIGQGFHVAVPEQPKKTMTAVVTNSIESGKRQHFLWLVDELQRSIFVSNDHDLHPGHFFQGRFVLLDDGRWKCFKYLQEVAPLFEGSLVRGRIEIIGTVEEYVAPRLMGDLPKVRVDKLGLVVDLKSSLPRNCVGRRIKIRELKQNDERIWAVFELL